METKFPSVLDKPLTRPKVDVPLSTFAYLYSEIIQNIHQRSSSIQEMESSLHSLGYDIGHRYLELMCVRDSKPTRRERSQLAAIQYINTYMFKALVGQSANGVEKSHENDSQYFMLWENPITDKFISTPEHMEAFRPAAFFAGIIAGALDAQGMPASVSAAPGVTGNSNQLDQPTVFVIQFYAMPV